MPAEIVHPVPPEEIDGWLRTLVRTFLDDPDSDVAVRRGESTARAWRPECNWGARDDGRWVATLGSDPRTLTVPGRGDTSELLAVNAITRVTVAATHRRRGLLRAMIEDALRDARERGDPLSMLIAVEYPIYGRYGYAPATVDCDYTLYPRRRGGQVAPGEPGRVRQVERDEALAAAADFFDRFRRRRAGQVDRDELWWQRSFGGDGWPEPRPALLHNWLLHDGDDGVDGLVGWSAVRQADSHPPLGAVEVFGPYAATDEAERDLWAYLTSLDLVDEIRLDHRPPDEPVRWLLPDARTLRVADPEDFLWLKLLDVPAALSARGYRVAGELVLDVTDDSAVSAAGRFRLTAEPDGGATCETTRAAPDLTLPITVLASAYLGGHSIAQQRIAGAVSEHTPGALARADAMFMTALAPWNATSF